MSTHSTKQGDYHRRLQLETSLATTGATGVTFYMRPAAGGAVTSWAGVIDSTYRISCTFPAGSLDTVGIYELEAALVFGDGQRETVPTVGRTTVVIGESLASLA